MKYFLLFILALSTTYAAQKEIRKRKLPLDSVNLQKEIFMRSYFKEYSFELLKQISQRSVNNKYIFDSLIAQGMQKYCQLAVDVQAIKSFDEYSLSELESIQVN